jgi:hypothetical protein
LLQGPPHAVLLLAAVWLGSPAAPYRWHLSCAARLFNTLPSRSTYNPLPTPAPKDAKPKVATPTANALDMRITGCGGTDVRVQKLEVQAGLLRLVRNKAGETEDLGIPRRLKVAVLAPNTTAEPLAACTWSLSGAVAAGAARTYKFPACAACAHCLVKMGFKCGQTYSLRVQARGRGQRVLASDWSRDLQWKAACSGEAGTACYA